MAPPVTRNQSRAQSAATTRRELEERLRRNGGMVGVIIDQFRPCPSLVGTRLERIRTQLRINVVDEVVNAESQGRSIDEQNVLADRLVPERMRRIDQCRRSMLHTVEAHDRYLGLRQDAGQMFDALETARRLYRATTRELGEVTQYDRLAHADFAAGTLLMVLEIIVLTHNNHRQQLYNLLVRMPPPEFNELFVMSQIGQFTEDVTIQHFDQIGQILGLFNQMPRDYQPHTSIVSGLRQLHEVLGRRRARERNQRRALATDGDEDADVDDDEDEEEDDDMSES